MPDASTVVAAAISATCSSRNRGGGCDNEGVGIFVYPVAAAAALAVLLLCCCLFLLSFVASAAAGRS